MSKQACETGDSARSSQSGVCLSLFISTPPESPGPATLDEAVSVVPVAQVFEKLHPVNRNLFRSEQTNSVTQVFDQVIFVTVEQCNESFLDALAVNL